MVAPREDTGTLGADVAYVGSWELGTDMKLVCNGVSTLVPVFATLAVLEYSACCIRRDGCDVCLGMFPMKMAMHSYANDVLAHFSETSQTIAAKNNWRPWIGFFQRTKYGSAPKSSLECT